MTLKRYRMEIVLIDTVVHIQARHDAGTGEWYAASEVDHEAVKVKHEMKINDAFLNIAIAALKQIAKDGHFTEAERASKALREIQASEEE